MVPKQSLSLARSVVSKYAKGEPRKGNCFTEAHKGNEEGLTTDHTDHLNAEFKMQNEEPQPRSAERNFNRSKRREGRRGGGLLYHFRMENSPLPPASCRLPLHRSVPEVSLLTSSPTMFSFMVTDLRSGRRGSRP